MGDQPEPTTTVLEPQSIRQLRWLAGGIWLALFIGLLVTSYAGIVGPMSNIDLALLQLENFQGLSDDEYSPNGDLIATFALIMTALIGMLVLVLWALFGRATTAFLSALADAEGDERSGPTPSVWLVAGGERSAFSEMMFLGGITWALLILRPVVIASLRVLTG